MLTAVRADLDRYRTLAQASTLGTVFSSKGFQATLVYRLGRLLQRWWSLRRVLFWPLLLPGLLVYALGILLVRKAYGIHLALSAKIGPGLYIGHFGGIRVTHCAIGAHCSLAQQCKIGRDGEPEGPRIGNRVWIGAHARVWGPISVADASTIGAGAYINRDVAARTLIMGNPARVMSSDYDNSKIL